jgi:hypothetical protein
MFQAMVPDADLARATHTAQEGEDGTISDARLAAALSDLPSIIVAIEEPELYQHPVQARVFARTLQELSQQPRAQVLLATHSPYFIQPERFSALRRFTYTRGVTSVASASFSSVAAMSRRGEAQVRKAISLHVPTEFSEGFFSNAVVLVEGPTDRAVLEATARKLGRDLDSQGVTVLSVESKNALRVAHAILTVLNIPTYLLADGDFTASEKRTKPQRHESHKADTEAITTYLSTTSHVLAGSLPYSFGDPTVICAAFTIWQGNIEEELGAWPSFTKALSAARTELPSRNDKNLLSYRNAVDAAMADDMPENLKLVVDAVSGLAARSQT